MSTTPQALTRGETIAVAALAMPYMVIKTAGRLIGRSLTRNPVAAQPAPPALAPAAVQPQGPVASPFTALVPANRVCSAEIGGQKVNFYQYFDAGVIRASCRANRILQEAMFTPAIAEECGIAYDLDGAIQWIRERGFGGARAQSVKKASQQQSGPVHSADADQVAAPFGEPAESAPRKRAEAGAQCSGPIPRAHARANRRASGTAISWTHPELWRRNAPGPWRSEALCHLRPENGIRVRAVHQGLPR